jgi:hypothetical protein
MVKRRGLKAWVIIASVVGAALLAAVIAQSGTPAEGKSDGHFIRGAGTTMLESGTGAPSFKPVITKVAFHWAAGAGHFECLALAPSADAGSPGSGNFDTNVMYVTGPITAAQINGDTSVLKGSSTVTGLGAGSDRPFTATVTRGGPGATLVLEVSGLTFREILLEGQFRF